MRILSKFPSAVAIIVLTSTGIAKLITAPTGHMVAPLILLDPILALLATFGTNLFSPTFELVILR